MKKFFGIKSKEEKIVKYVEYLSLNDLDKKIKAIDKLTYLASHGDNYQAIREAGAIRPLVGLLNDADSWVRSKSAETLGELAHGIRDNQQAICEAGAIRPLVGLLSDEGLFVKGRAVAALHELAKDNKQNQQAIREAGAIRPLVGLLNDANKLVRHQSAQTLGCLADGNKDNQQAIREAGAIRPLVGLLNDADKWGRLGSAETLGCLADGNKDNQQAIREAGAIRPLVGMLSEEYNFCREYSAQLLCELSKESQQAIREAGGITALTALQNDTDESVKKYAKEALERLEKNRDNKIAIEKEKAKADIRKKAERGVRSYGGGYASGLGGAKKLSSHTLGTVLPEEKKPDTAIAFSSPEKTHKQDSHQLGQSQTSSASPLQSLKSNLTATSENLTTSSRSSEDQFDFKGLGASLPLTYIPSEQISLGVKLGQGAYGAVYEGEYKFRKVAVKRYDGSRLPERAAREVRHEVGIMLRLDHECLVRFLGLVQDADSPAMLVMEHGANGSLYDFLQSDQDISWGLRLRLAEELARGLAYLHEEKVIHRDIKSLNVVLDRDLRAKWCDFGLAALKLHTTTTSKATTESAVGTTYWMAPELFSRKNSAPSMASDVWALGMVFFELASRQIPFATAMDRDQVKDWIKEGDGEEVPEACRRESPLLANIMERCWAERTGRPLASSIARELSADQERNTRPNTSGKANPPAASSGFMPFSNR